MTGPDRHLTDDALVETAAVLRVLGHPDRLRMLSLLMRRDMPVCELAETLGLAPNAVSQHLGLLEARGVVSRRRSGRYVHYRASHRIAKTLIRCMWRHLGEPESLPAAAAGRKR